MHTNVTRISTAVAGGALLSLLAATAGATPAGGTGIPRAGPAAGAVHARAVSGAQLWASRFTGPGDRSDNASSVAVSPRGDRVFVTGFSLTAASAEDYATIAYSSATGARLWLSRYNGPGNSADQASSVAVSPDGRTVFVTGTSTGKTSGDDYATVAYRAATGARLWVTRYTGPGRRFDSAATVVASPSGRTVFVTGMTTRTATGQDFATVAYDAATGRQQWVRYYSGPGTGSDGATSAAVNRSGTILFVTGGSGDGGMFSSDFATVAYSAATGSRLWASRYSGPANGTDSAASVAVSPSGRTVFVTGTSTGTASSGDYATLAYSAATGAQLWLTRYNGPRNSADWAKAVRVSPDGARVFVTGVTGGEMGPALDSATVAYRAATGRQLWVRLYNGPASEADGSIALAVSPSGRVVYVTGSRTGKTSGADFATFAYRAGTGSQLWARFFTGPGSGSDGATSIAVSPDGSRVFVTGISTGKASGEDYLTIAYQR